MPFGCLSAARDDPELLVMAHLPVRKASDGRPLLPLSVLDHRCATVTPSSSFSLRAGLPAWINACLLYKQIWHILMRTCLYILYWANQH